MNEHETAVVLPAQRDPRAFARSVEDAKGKIDVKTRPLSYIGGPACPSCGQLKLRGARADRDAVWCFGCGRSAWDAELVKAVRSGAETRRAA